MPDGDGPAAPRVLVRRWFVGVHLAHLSIARPEPGKAAVAAFSWMAATPESLTHLERAELDAGIASALKHVERATGMRPTLTGDLP